MNDQIKPASLKQALRQLRDSGDTTHQRFQDLTLPRGEITLAWGLGDPGHVFCVAYTREPLTLAARPVVDRLLAAFNRTSAIKIDFEAADATDGVHATDCLCAGFKITFNQFITEPEMHLHVLFLAAVPDALFTAVDMLNRVAAGETAAEVIREHSLKVIALITKARKFPR